MQGILNDFITGLPKAELHLHIEGTLTPQLKREIARRNEIELGEKTFTPLEIPANAGEAATAKAIQIQQYRMFLDLYFEGLKVLQTEQDFRDLAFDYMRSCHDNAIRYAELSFDPQAHTNRDIPFGLVVEGLAAGCKDGFEQFGIRSNLIMCINRDLTLDSALAMLDDAKPYRDTIVGLGLDSVEEGHPPIKFQQAYDRARDDGYRLTAHCDVDMVDAREHIRQCVEELGVERIDHGINTIEDERLIELMKINDICLTACPTWRNGDPAPRRVDRIRKMYELGLKVTLNTDDPGYFISGPMNNMLPPVAAIGAFTPADLQQFMINAFDAAWIPREDRDAYIAEVNAYVAAAAA